MTKFNSIGQPGDLVGLLTNMSLGDALVCEAQSANIQDSLIEILPAALSSFVSDIVIGKGPSAQSIRINLPKFTFVACVANDCRTLSMYSKSIIPPCLTCALRNCIVLQVQRRYPLMTRRVI